MCREKNVWSWGVALVLFNRTVKSTKREKRVKLKFSGYFCWGLGVLPLFLGCCFLHWPQVASESRIGWGFTSVSCVSLGGDLKGFCCQHFNIRVFTNLVAWVFLDGVFSGGSISQDRIQVFSETTTLQSVHTAASGPSPLSSISDQTLLTLRQFTVKPSCLSPQ